VTFQPGQSGNPGGRRKEKPYRDALRKVLAEFVTDEDPKEPRTKLEAVARRHVAEALAGEMTAINGIADRLDGKPAQAIANDDETDGPFVIKVIRGAEQNG
jgi:hypothetical protein